LAEKSGAHKRDAEQAQRNSSECTVSVNHTDSTYGGLAIITKKDKRNLRRGQGQIFHKDGNGHKCSGPGKAGTAAREHGGRREN